MRPTPAAPALVATYANVNAHNASQVNVSSGSEILSVTSSTERLRRAQLARAQLELAEARVKVAQAELDLASGSQAGSVGRLTDVRSEGGNSARARPRSSADLAAPLIQLEESEERVPETGTLPTLQESNEEHLSPKGESALTSLELLSPKGERASNPSHTFVLNQNIINDGCNFGTATANSWQETHAAVENVVNIAEERHQEVMFNMASTTSESHQLAMAQLASEANKALQEQAR